MNVALDIDGTISENPAFFAVLSSALRAAGHRLFVLTYRDPDSVEAIKTQLATWGVECDEVIIAESLESKGCLCETHGIEIFFDDQDECIVPVPEHILVFKVRNGGNFNFARKRWISTGRMTELIR